MRAPGTLIYGGLDPARSIAPSVLSDSIAAAARISLSAGQFQIRSRQLTTEEVRRSVLELQTGHVRLAPDDNLVLLDAGAMLAYAPYRARIVLAADPLACVEEYAQSLDADADVLRIRLHDCLLSAVKIVTLSNHVHDAVLPFLPNWPERKTYPSVPLRFSQASDAGILVVDNDAPDQAKTAIATLEQEFPSETFAAYDAEHVFARPWKMVLHLGLVRDLGLGARLSDAWAGGVPVLQCVDSVRLEAYRRHQHQSTTAFVEHGKTGLRFRTMNELSHGLGELLSDSLPARAVARAVRHRIDPAAEWDALLTEIFL